ncbi:putative ribonuclease H-like domain-containing protein [Tanacetum coccineum]
MSTSKTYQQSLADAGSDTRPLMLERGSYIPWASRFRRYINRKRENQKWLNKVLDEGPYQFEMFIPNNSTVSKLQTAEDLQGDALLHYDAEMELMNLILISIPNDIYNSVDACTSAKDIWKRVERLMRGTIKNKVDRETHFTNEFDQFVVEPGEALVLVYNRFAQLMNVRNKSSQDLILPRTMRWQSFPCSNSGSMRCGKSGSSSTFRSRIMPLWRKDLQKENDGKGPSLTAHRNVTTNEHQLTFNHCFTKAYSNEKPSILQAHTRLDSLSLTSVKTCWVDWQIDDGIVRVKRSPGAINDEKNLAFLTTTGASSINNINTVNPEHEGKKVLSVRKIIIEGSSTAGYDKSKVECFNYHKMRHFARECRAPRVKDTEKNQEDEIQANMALMAFTDSEVSNDKSCSKSCLQNYEALKKPYDDLLVKLDDTAFKAYTYKRGLSILEGQIIKYKESEVLFSEEIALLKRSVGHKEYLMGLLKTELEKVKEEKEGFEFKIAKFEKSSKDLDQLLASQITDKSKKGFGYNVVPSPHPLILNRPTPLDLSYSGLQEFKQPEVNEYGLRDSNVMPITGCDKESDNSKENTDDSLKQQQKTDSSLVKSPLKVDKDWKEKFFCPANQVREEEPKKARENNDAPIIEDWVSDDEEEVEPIPKVEKKTVIPTATKKEFVKPAKPIRRSVSCPNAHKHMVPRAVLMKTGLKTVNNARPVNTVSYVYNFGGEAKGGELLAKLPTTFWAEAVSTACYVQNRVLVVKPHNKTPYELFRGIKPAIGFMKPFGCHVTILNTLDKLGKFDGKSDEEVIQANMIKGFVDSGYCSRHMFGNIAQLFQNFKDFDGMFCYLLVEEKMEGEITGQRTPQQNGVDERKNRTLVEAARTMLADSKLPTTFRAEAVSTACYAQNRVLIVKPHNKTPYEFFKGIKPAIGFMKLFGCHVTILNTLDKLGKFDEKSDEGFFVGYSLSSKAFRVYDICLIVY